MKRNWGRIARHYLASLTSYLYGRVYGVYKGVKTVYHFAKKEFDKAAYNLNAFLVHTFFFPFYSIYRFSLGSYELATNRTVRWYR